MIFDTHIHLNDEKLLTNLDFYISEAKRAGVNKFLVVGWDIPSSKIASDLSKKYKEIYAAIAVMPTSYETYDDNSINELKAIYFDNPSKIVAIGEIGLDFHYEKTEEIISKQERMFKEEITLANELNLPISIHSRDSIERTYQILKENPVNKKGIMHCYSGSLEMAKKFIDLGYFIAFGGVLTYKNSQKIKDVFLNIPLNKIVFETDAPYLSPVPHRGEINHPSYIKETIIYGANLRNINENELEKITYNNAMELFSREKN